MSDQFRVEFDVLPVLDSDTRYRIRMSIWDENGNYYCSIPIREYGTFDRALEVQMFLVNAKYELGEATQWK